MIAKKIEKLASYCSKIHHIKGRIRVRVSPKIKEQQGNVSLQDIEELPQKIEGIKKIKINKIVGSVTIEYDPEIFEERLWDDLISGRNSDEVAQIIKKLQKEVA